MKPFLSFPCGMAFVALMLLGGCTNDNVLTTKYRMLIGTYTQNTGSKGIYVCEMDVRTGAGKQLSVAEGVVNPSYLALSPDRKFVYAVNEFGDSSGVSAFAFDEHTATLSPLNAVNTHGEDPCYIALTARHVVTADYSSGTISVFGRAAGGLLTEVLQTIRHTGRGVDSVRQANSHVHQTLLTRNGQYLLATDLGADKMVVYRYQPEEQVNIFVPIDSLAVKAGSGARHIAFDRNETTGYLLQELDGTLTVFSMDENGKLALLQETSVARQEGVENGAADIHLSPDGRFVYATNRGTANNITCFAVGASDGLLTFVEQIATGGEGPRNFAITPDGRYVFVAHQASGNITIFARDMRSGKLTNTGKMLYLPAPVCIVWL